MAIMFWGLSKNVGILLIHMPQQDFSYILHGHHWALTQLCHWHCCVIDTAVSWQSIDVNETAPLWLSGVFANLKRGCLRKSASVCTNLMKKPGLNNLVRHVFSWITMSTVHSDQCYRVIPVECVYCTEPKATCRQCKNQPNAYNMYTDLEGIRSACLYLHVSFYSGVVYFCRLEISKT
jgi:hypothetical protein